jgi:exosortase A
MITASSMQAHKMAATALGVYVLCLFLVYNETLVSMVSIWWRSDTFAHGFLILPISLWLVWDRRDSFAGMAAKPELRALVFLLGSGFVWMIARVANVLVIEQYAFVAMLISGTWVILGNRYTLALAFPLGFLFFAVPAGEGLVPPMMELTATSTVSLLRLTGIPVYREGLYFTLPTGNWSVIEACSGVRYLIASLTLGCLFAYLSYTSFLKRGIFVVASIIVPVVGNTLRAYMIVMLGHLSEMKLATGVDHLIYGWFFFGILMLILFSIGAIWRDAPPVAVGGEQQSTTAKAGQTRTPVVATLLVVVAASAWFFLERNLEQEPVSVAPLQLPSQLGAWEQEDSASWTWKPESRGADQRVSVFYRSDAGVVAAYVGLYLAQDQDSELVNSTNAMVGGDDLQWRITASESVPIVFDGKELAVRQVTLKGSSNNILIWYWYRLGNRYTSIPYMAKLYEVWNYISRGRQDSAQVLFATEINGDPERAATLLRRYINDSLPGIELSIDTLVGEVE